jgi:hypothetical protein
VPDLARQRLQAAREQENARAQEYLAGRGTLDILLQAARQVLEAELALCDRPVDRAAAWERYWTRAKIFELVNEERWKRGRLSLADYMQSRYIRLDAEIGWAEARAQPGVPPAAVAGALNPWPRIARDEPNLGQGDLPTPEQLAKAKQVAVRADVQQLKRDRLTAARKWFEPRDQEYMAGWGTLDVLIEAARHLGKAELAVCQTPAERAAACERHWTRAWLIENTNEQKYQAGRLSLADLAVTRYFRLEAEIAWARARAAQAKE